MGSLSILLLSALSFNLCLSQKGGNKQRDNNVPVPVTASEPGFTACSTLTAAASCNASVSPSCAWQSFNRRYSFCQCASPVALDIIFGIDNSGNVSSLEATKHFIADTMLYDFVPSSRIGFLLFGETGNIVHAPVQEWPSFRELKQTITSIASDTVSDYNMDTLVTDACDQFATAALDTDPVPDTLLIVVAKDPETVCAQTLAQTASYLDTTCQGTRVAVMDQQLFNVVCTSDEQSGGIEWISLICPDTQAPTAMPSSAPSFSRDETSANGCCDCLDVAIDDFCGNVECSDTVCGFDPFCCSNSWDDICNVKAFAVCVEQPFPGCCDCAISSDIGCGNTDCQQQICPTDPFCCGEDELNEGFWDNFCVQTAFDVCKSFTN